MSAATDQTAKKALAQLPKLRGCQVHTSVMQMCIRDRYPASDSGGADAYYDGRTAQAFVLYGCGEKVGI